MCIIIVTGREAYESTRTVSFDQSIVNETLVSSTEHICGLSQVSTVSRPRVHTSADESARFDLYHQSLRRRGNSAIEMRQY